MLEQRIREIITKNNFSGTILLSHKGNDVIAIACGEADRSNNRLNQLDTKYGIASGTKGFTATGIMKLIDDGKLSLETTINEIIDAFKNYPHEVTVQHLLTHTSGIPDYFDEEVMESEDFEKLWITYPVNTLESPLDFFPMFIERPVDFKPGERFKYNNAGYIVLARVIEVVSGKSFIDYMTSEIIQPLGLEGTGFYYQNNLPGNSSYGYLEDGSTNIFSIPFVGGGDGGIYTTVYDMKKYWQELVQGEFLSKELKALAFSPVVEEEGPNYYYGLGHYVLLEKGELSKLTLVGGDPGVAFYSYSDVKKDLILTMIGNDENTLWEIRKSIVDLVEGYF